MKWLIITGFVASTAVGLISTSYNRGAERKEDSKLWLWLMLGGFIWSQIQTEYLIWRNKRNMKQFCK